MKQKNYTKLLKILGYFGMAMFFFGLGSVVGRAGLMPQVQLGRAIFGIVLMLIGIVIILWWNYPKE